LCDIHILAPFARQEEDKDRLFRPMLERAPGQTMAVATLLKIGEVFEQKSSGRHLYADHTHTPQKQIAIAVAALRYFGMGTDAVLTFGDRVREPSNSFLPAPVNSNMLAELTAALEAVRALRKSYCAQLFTDPSFVFRRWLTALDGNPPARARIDVFRALLEAPNRIIGRSNGSRPGSAPQRRRAFELARQAVLAAAQDREARHG
jgi:hypothetical protein